MKVLVTGGAGFIGSHLVDRLIKEGHKVMIFDDLSGGKTENLNPESVFVQEDLRELEENRWNGDVFDVVFHLAANAAENKAQFAPIDITSRNYDASIKLLTRLLQSGFKGRFVYTSSIAVYGALQTPFKETDKPEPEDLYGITKLAFEQTLKVMSKVHGFEYVITRPHNVYGPRQNMTDPYRNVVTIWMNERMRLHSIPIYGDGEQRRCFSYIDDVVEALYKCGFDNVAGKAFNIGSDQDYSLNELADLITQGDGRWHHLPSRPQEVSVAISDHTECKEILGYHETPLKEGIEKTWEWARKMGPQDPIYGGIEIESPKMPENWRK